MKQERQTTSLLLEKGVQVPVTAPFFWRLFFGKKLKVNLPTVEVLAHIAALYLSIKPHTDESLTLRESFEIVKLHQKTVSKMIAWCVVNNPRHRWAIPMIAKHLRRMPANVLMQYYQLVVMYGGLEDFINIIRLVEATRITMPMNLSQQDQTS